MPREDSLNMACGQGEAGTETGIHHKDVSSRCRGTCGLLAMAFATCPQWPAYAGPSSQYGHILCCVQEENTNLSGEGMARALNHMSMDRQSSLWAVT